ncbi:MAG: hypothetical protein QG577_1172, partial [Thermodesulfobacteriota bacterium]|nr:hypothetical protein [Thermodesulfobacteriota bacterium]
FVRYRRHTTKKAHTLWVRQAAETLYDLSSMPIVLPALSSGFYVGIAIPRNGMTSYITWQTS